MQIWQARWPVAALIVLLATTACSEKKPADKPATPSVAQKAAPPGAQPPAPQAPAQPTAAPATEKHVLSLTNYAQSPVTVTINGEWVGQWDQNVQAPLSTVQKGKNDLIVEVGGEAKGQITLAVYAVRDNQNVSLMTLNFDGKPGKHSFSFGAK
jgi:hypothetical protein